MGIFTLFMFFWCSGALFFPIMSTAVSLKSENSEEKSDVNEISGATTVFLDDFNHKVLFTIEGNLSSRQIVEHGGKTYLVYFDKIEENKIYMCVKAVLSISSD